MQKTETWSGRVIAGGTHTDIQDNRATRGGGHGLDQSAAVVSRPRSALALTMKSSVVMLA
jgi:hypothetical protein